MNVLLTGATGLIGSHVAAALLLQSGWTVIAPVRKTHDYKNTDILAERGALLEEGLYWERPFVESIFRRHHIDCVMHLAAMRGAGKGSWGEYSIKNVAATGHLLNSALHHGVKRFLFCSSVGVWGTIPRHVPPDMTVPLIQDSFYHRSKIEAEEKVHASRKEGLDAVIVRPTITYGVGDNGFPATMVGLVRARKFFFPGKDVLVHFVSAVKVAELFVCLAQQRIDEPVVCALDKAPLCLKGLADMIHEHYYGRPYPRYFQLPHVLFAFAAGLAGFARSQTWSTRFNLLCRDWHYNSMLPAGLGFEPAETEQAFQDYLRALP